MFPELLSMLRLGLHHRADSSTDGSQGRPDLPCRHPLYNLGALDRTIVGNWSTTAPAPLSDTTRIAFR